MSRTPRRRACASRQPGSGAARSPRARRSGGRHAPVLAALPLPPQVLSRELSRNYSGPLQRQFLDDYAEARIHPAFCASGRRPWATGCARCRRRWRAKSGRTRSTRCACGNRGRCTRRLPSRRWPSPSAQIPASSASSTRCSCVPSPSSGPIAWRRCACSFRRGRRSIRSSSTPGVRRAPTPRTRSATPPPKSTSRARASPAARA